MEKIFRTFSVSIGYGDLESDISEFANKNGYVEVDRSAPALAGPCDGDWSIAVTSTFIPKTLDTEN